MIPALKQFVRQKMGYASTDELAIIAMHNGYSYSNPKVSFVVFCNGAPVLFLKSVRHVAENGVIRDAFASLQRAWEACGGAGLRLPQPLWCEEVEGRAVSAESIIQGRPLRTDHADERRRSMEWMMRFVERMAARMSGEMQNVAETCEMFMEGIHCEDPIIIGEIRAWFDAALERAGGRDLVLPSIMNHGDCTPSNILFCADGRVGAVDWDAFGTIRVPGYDVLSYADRAARGRNLFLEFQSEWDSFLKIMNLSTEVGEVLVVLYSLATAWRKRRHHHPAENASLDVEFGAEVRRIRSAYEASRTRV